MAAPLAGAAAAPDIAASPIPATAKPTIKIIRIMIYLPEEKMVSEDLPYIGHQALQVGQRSSCSARSRHTFASVSCLPITRS
jgi:hypothetical protein